MGVTPEGGVSLRRTRASLGRARSATVSDAATAAWLTALPSALVTYLVVVTVGPWLGERLLPASPTVTFLNPGFDTRADAHEIGQYLLALAGPILLSLAIVAFVRRKPLLPRLLVTGIVVLAQAVLILTIVACFTGQRRPQFGYVYFSDRTLAVSACIAAVLLAAARSMRLRQLLGAHEHEPRWRRLTIGAVAVVAVVIWMAPAINTDHTIAWASDVIQYHTAFYLDEAFALLNGLTPLVSFTPQYGALWPYVIALPMLVFGTSVLTYTVAMSVVTSVALLAVYGVLRRVTRNALAALLLFIPFLATTLFPIGETPEKLVSLGTWFAFYPLRFAGPLLLAWLTARHLSASPGRRAWPLFVAAGLVALNNVDAGIAALGATLGALLWTSWPRDRAQALSLATNVGGGVAVAVAIVTVVTLVRSGSLPHFAQLSEFARIFTLNGYGAVPMPGVRGLPLLIYITYAAAIATATVLTIQGARDRVLTGMLLWTGVFGLGAASYYVARDVLPITFSTWALAIVLLAVVAFRALAAHRLRRDAAMAFVAFFGVGIAICSIAQIPAPWAQVPRLRNTPIGIEADAKPMATSSQPEARRFVAGLADGPHRFVLRPGAPAVILTTTGHRIADDYGIRDVSPYSGSESILTVEQAERTLDVLRDEGGNTVLMLRTDNVALNRILVRRGFKVVTAGGLRTPRIKGAQDFEAITRLGPASDFGLVKWVDTRHLHPRALR
jgi:hypothetical protein